MAEIPSLGDECPWSPLDSAYRVYVGVFLIISGILGVVANGWLVTGFLISPLLNIKTHLLILNLTVNCLGRGLLAGFPFAGTSILAGRWLFGAKCCQLFAFLQQLFGMSQVAAVTMLAVERVMVTRYLYSRTHPPLQQYVTGILLCWTTAALWSVPPLLSWGRYGCDPTAMSCSLQWDLNTGYSSKIYNICLLLLGGILPATLMSFCIWCAVSSEGRSSAGMDVDRLSQRALTKTVGVLVPGLCLMWLPHSLLVLWSLTGIPLPVPLVILATMSSEASAVIPISACMACDQNMRRALLGILGISTYSPAKNGR
ncbi:visual pigment-like receptor peropsin [Cryptotermes secundus]|uniref:visual pigment-like receptor peropsin n=1 Tax=Cryptotermes secundus TaxID=105785 RepID=UPI000CD7BE0B|nr:visual pigment-like receptor peropsin [Cryptotermes secundus]